MILLLRSLLFATFVAVIKYTLILGGGTLWDLTLVSISGLVAGIFFLLAMTFQAALRDYKKADITIAEVRGSLLSLYDMNITAQLNNKKHNPAAYNKALTTAATAIRKFVRLETTYNTLEKALQNLTIESHKLHAYLTPQQVRVLLGHQGTLRDQTSYLSFVKDVRFPTVGYVFLYGFIGILILLQLFAHADNIYLEVVFIFSLTAVLGFFAEFIRNLDGTFVRTGGSFMPDTRPLEGFARTIQGTKKVATKKKS